MSAATRNERDRQTVLHALRLLHPKGMSFVDVQRVLFPLSGDMPGRARVLAIMRPLIEQRLVGERAGLWFALAPPAGQGGAA